MTTSEVKLAEIGDEAEIFDHLVQAHAENGFNPLCSEKVNAVIREATHKKGGVIGLVWGPKGIEASTGLRISEWWYSDRVHLEELWTFVGKDFRRTSHAKSLLKFQKDFSEKMTLAMDYRVNLFTGVLTKIQMEAKVRLYQRELPQVGALFMYGGQGHDTFNQRKFKQ